MTVEAGPATTEDRRVLVEDRDGVRLLAINRPSVRNAIDLATAAAIEQAVDELESDPTLRVLVVTGRGGTFCAGMDLKAFVRGERPSTERRGFAGFVESPPTKPVIAAVEGHAVAGGFEIVLACDLVVASTDAAFALPEVKRGLMAAGGGLMRLPLRIPYHRAMEVALTGRVLTSTEAADLGLVNRLVEPGRAVDEAKILAGEIVRNGPLAVMGTKHVIAASRHWHPESAFDAQRAITEPVRASRDAIEGANAFLEKRPPRWEAR